MSRRPSCPGARCDCVVCFGYRLAIAITLVGFGILVLLASLIHADEQKPMLIDATPAKAAPLGLTPPPAQFCPSPMPLCTGKRCPIQRTVA